MCNTEASLLANVIARGQGPTLRDPFVAFWRVYLRCLCLGERQRCVERRLDQRHDLVQRRDDAKDRVGELSEAVEESVAVSCQRRDRAGEQGFGDGDDAVGRQRIADEARPRDGRNRDVHGMGARYDADGQGPLHSV